MNPDEQVQDARSITWDGYLLGCQTPKKTKPSAVGLDLTSSYPQWQACGAGYCGLPANNQQPINGQWRPDTNSEYHGDHGTKGECMRLRPSLLCQDCKTHLEAWWVQEHYIRNGSIPYHTIWNLLYRPSGRGFMMLAGLVDLWVGSGSEGLITDVMEGYKYNRVGRLHKIV